MSLPRIIEIGGCVIARCPDEVSANLIIPLMQIHCRLLEAAKRAIMIIRHFPDNVDEYHEDKLDAIKSLKEAFAYAEVEV